MTMRPSARVCGWRGRPRGLWRPAALRRSGRPGQLRRVTPGAGPRPGGLPRPRRRAGAESGPAPRPVRPPRTGARPPAAASDLGLLGVHPAEPVPALHYHGDCGRVREESARLRPAGPGQPPGHEMTPAATGRSALHRRSEDRDRAISTVRAFTRTAATGSPPSPNHRHAVCGPVPCNRARFLRFTITF
jgi:hypothetical protein